MSEEVNESKISIGWAPSVLLISTSYEELSLFLSSIDGSLEIKCTDESHYLRRSKFQG
jgi:hypothetical protein